VLVNYPHVMRVGANAVVSIPIHKPARQEEGMTGDNPEHTRQHDRQWTSSSSQHCIGSLYTTSALLLHQSTRLKLLALPGHDTAAPVVDGMVSSHPFASAVVFPKGLS
jgi:hypothetical protein